MQMVSLTMKMDFQITWRPQDMFQWGMMLHVSNGSLTHGVNSKAVGGVSPKSQKGREESRWKLFTAAHEGRQPASMPNVGPRQRLRFMLADVFSGN